MSQIEVFKRHAEKRIGLDLDGLKIHLTTYEAITLMIHLGAVIDWAMSMELRDSEEQLLKPSNAKDDRRSEADAVDPLVKGDGE